MQFSLGRYGYLVGSLGEPSVQGQQVQLVCIVCIYSFFVGSQGTCVLQDPYVQLLQGSQFQLLYRSPRCSYTLGSLGTTVLQGCQVQLLQRADRYNYCIGPVDTNTLGASDTSNSQDPQVQIFCRVSGYKYSIGSLVLSKTILWDPYVQLFCGVLGKAILQGSEVHLLYMSLCTTNLQGSTVQVVCAVHRCSYPVGFLDTATLTSWSVVGKQVPNQAV